MTLEPFKWRGTHVELPRNRDVVLVYGRELVGVDGKPIAFAWHDHDGWHDARGPHFDLDFSRVTDWAELPTGAE